MSVHATRVVPVVLGLCLLLAGLSAAASASPDHLPPPPPPCYPLYTTIHFHIWNTNGVSDGVINFGGTNYYDGGSKTIAYGCSERYAISGSSTSSVFYFRQWASDSGPFDSSMSASTYFYPSGDAGGITLVLGEGLSAQSPSLNVWGGYVAAVNLGTSNYLVSGAFVVPLSYTYVTAPNGGEDLVSFWDGVGGVNGNGNLWQAGVGVQLHNGQAPGLYPWYEQVSPGSGCCGSFSLAWIPGGGYSVAPGDTITVRLGYYQEPLMNITDGTSWATRKWTTNFEPCEWGPALAGLSPSGYCMSGFQPDTTTAEWIAEAPTTPWGLFGSPCGVPQGYRCVMPNYGSVNFPYDSMSATGFPGWAMPFERLIGYDYQDHDYSNPGLIYSAYMRGSGSWSDQYGTSPSG